MAEVSVYIHPSDLPEAEKRRILSEVLDILLRPRPPADETPPAR